VAAEEELVAAVLISEADLAALATTSACQEPPPVLPEVASAGATLEDLAYRFLNSSASYRRPCSHDLAKRSSKVRAPGVSPLEPLSVLKYEVIGE